MTNKEAIKTIKSIVETLDDYAFYTAEEKDAFDLAIKALEARQRLEEAISSMEANDTWSCHISKLKAILGEEE